jgi:FixJ family two-component response regulator
MRFAIDAMKAGAVDCLLLSHTQHALLGTVEDALALVRAARAEQDASSEAREQIEPTYRTGARCAAWAVATANPTR